MRHFVIEVDDDARDQRVAAVEPDADSLDRRLPECGHCWHGRRHAGEIQIKPIAADELDVPGGEPTVALEDDTQGAVFASRAHSAEQARCRNGHRRDCG